MPNELENIKARYEARKASDVNKLYSSNNFYNNAVIAEREQFYHQIFNQKFQQTHNLSLLEIGAGSGGNISGFLKMGFKLKNLVANELLDDRVEALKNNFPELEIYPGNVLEANFNQQFDVVFQSTVFTSILDKALKQQIADKMYELVKPNGIILWYDFIYDNPNNKDVKGVSKQEIKQLFAKASKITFKKVTLAPPIGRRVGKLYGILNGMFPFLRSHVVAVIEK